METFYLNPHNAKKPTSALRIGLSRFSHISNRQLILIIARAVGFFIGSVVFGIFAYSMAEHEYQFSNFGVDGFATITDCRMVAGRGNPNPLITIHYEVNGESYSNSWLAALKYKDCSQLPQGMPVQIIYLENDPASAIEGTMAEFHSSGYAFPLFIAVGAVGFVLIVLVSVRQVFGYVSSLRQWWSQSSQLIALKGEIIALKPSSGKRRKDTEFTYLYRSPSGERCTGHAIYQPRKRRNDHPPKIGLSVIVLHYDEDIIALA